MANGFIVIDKSNWESATPEQRELMTFQTLQSIDRRLQVLEKRPIIDKCFSFAGGVIGGALAFCGLKWGV